VALAVVRTTKLRASSGTSVSGTVTAPTAGNLLAVVVASWNATAHSVTDDATGGANSYTQRIQQTDGGGNDRSSIHEAANCRTKAGGLTVTATVTNSSYGGVCFITEISGADASPFTAGEVNSGSGNGSPATTGSVTNSVADSIFVASVTNASGNSATNITPSASWVMDSTNGREIDGSNYQVSGVATQIVSTSAARSCSWTLPYDENWAACIVAYKAASGGSGATMAAALAAAAALAQSAGLQSGSALGASLGTATALSPSGILVAGNPLAAALATATALSPSGSLRSGGVLIGALGTASALSPASGLASGSGLAAILAAAAALSPGAAVLSGSRLEAALALASALSPAGVISGITPGGGLLAATAVLAAALSPSAMVLGNLATPARYPTLESDSGGGTEPWGVTGNAGSNNTVYDSITAPSFDAGDYSGLLKLQGFGFSIPLTATILGVVVEMECRCGAGSAQTRTLQLLDASGALFGSNKATVQAWPATDGIISYGGSSDLWAATLTPAVVNDPDFGVGLAVDATSANTDIYVDFVRMFVYYRDPAGLILAALATATSSSPASTLGGGSVFPAAVALAAALSQGASLGGGTTLAALVGLASSLSPASTLRSGSVLSAQAGLATALSPVSGLAGAGAVAYLLAGLTVASALSPASTLGVGSRLAGAVLTATALARSGALGGGASFLAGPVLATAASPSGGYVTSSKLLAALASALASTHVADIFTRVGTGNVIVHPGAGLRVMAGPGARGLFASGGAKHKLGG
jgi:hypothetical protein